jgi:hypothetical protein
MSDLIQRLRKAHRSAFDVAILDEAADRIAKLEAALLELSERHEWSNYFNEPCRCPQHIKARWLTHHLALEQA